ncbi:NADPH-dependent aldehyde reductase Ahr [Pleionea sediminis]|uniref:NADPH-dependent aldehyde reductase Ahr n=1 Tax=Pleionea sediminis TaxID=2569479 RepID=UPI001185DC93|nr:NAD(P)-dependent alcohol dehydrogenase [Pleionea sediminis]
MFNAFAAQEAGGELLPLQYDPGALKSDDVEIEVEYCGLCHSDLSMLDNEWGMTEYPFVPGHEVAGVISATGSNVTHLNVGDRVGLGWHAGYCNTCYSCHSGDHNLCGSAQGTIIGRHGGFADKVRAQATSVVKLPDSLSTELAGPLFCGGITVFNPMKQFELEPTAKVGVIGIGGLGHMALQFLNAWGCEVTAFTSSEAKKKEALEMGAHHTLNSADTAALEKSAGQFDLILSTVNVKLDWEAYMQTLKPKGRLHFVGAVLEPIEIAAFSLIAGQRSISGSPVGAPATISDMLEFAVRHDIAPKVEVFDLSEVNTAIEHLKSGKARYRVVLKVK